MASNSVHEIESLIHDLKEASKTDQAICDLYTASAPIISARLERVLQVEIREKHSRKVRSLCENARTFTLQQIERQRWESPAVKADRTIKGAIDNLSKLKADAEKRLDEERETRRLKWWFDLTRPDFTEVDEKIQDLTNARQKLHASGDLEKTDRYFRDLTNVVERRTREIERNAISAIPTHPDDSFNEERVVEGALMLAALSVPVSAWDSCWGQLRFRFGRIRGIPGFLWVSGACWLGWQDSNLRMAVPKTAALPLGYTPAGAALYSVSLRDVKAPVAQGCLRRSSRAACPRNPRPSGVRGASRRPRPRSC